jgi:hypothetical protein
MYTPDNLQKKIDIFTQYPDVGLVYSDLSFIDGAGDTILGSFFTYRGIPYYQNSTVSVDDYILAPAGPIASWSTCMVRADILEKYPITSKWPDIRYSVADYDWYMQVCIQHRIYGIPEPLTQYRRHTNNLSGANGGTSYDLSKLVEIYLAEGKISRQVHDTKQSWLSLTFALFALEHREKYDAYTHLRDACRYDIYYKIHYKACIVVLLLLPSRLFAYMLRWVMRRGK